jgi:hypothetical protein
MKSATESKQMPYGISVITKKKYGVFRVKEENGAIAKILSKFKPIAEKLDFWAYKDIVDTLKLLPEFKAFISNFTKTKISFEIAGSVGKGELQELAVLVVAHSDDSVSPVAVARWIKDQGCFFQNLLYDAPQPVEAILAKIEVKFHQPEPAR